MTTPTGQIISGLNALMDEYTNITHNMANNHTTGFKRRLNAFSAELERLQSGDLKDSPLKGEIVSQSVIDFSQGGVVKTDRELDVALCGKGFLMVETPDGPMYTRNGSLELNSINQLVDLNGYIVAGEDGPIVIPRGKTASDLSLTEDVVVNAGDSKIGKLKLVDFGDNEYKLRAAGAGTFLMPDENVDPVKAEKLRIRQGFREGSNVKMVEEMVNMMTVARLYETSVQMLRKQRENSSAMLDVAKTSI